MATEKKKCACASCSDMATAKGFCPRHYMRWRRYGSPYIVYRRKMIEAKIEIGEKGGSKHIVKKESERYLFNKSDMEENKNITDAYERCNKILSEIPFIDCLSVVGGLVAEAVVILSESNQGREDDAFKVVEQTAREILKSSRQ